MGQGGGGAIKRTLMKECINDYLCHLSLVPTDVLHHLSWVLAVESRRWLGPEQIATLMDSVAAPSRLNGPQQ